MILHYKIAQKVFVFKSTFWSSVFNDKFVVFWSVHLFIFVSQFSIRLSQSASNASHESNLGTLSLLLRNRDRICHEEDVTNTLDHTLRLCHRLAMIRQIENHIWWAASWKLPAISQAGHDTFGYSKVKKVSNQQLNNLRKLSDFQTCKGRCTEE